MCVSVGHVSESCKTAEMRFRGDSHGPKEPCIRWGRDLPTEGAFLGLSGPLKSIGSLCCGVRSKSDHSVLNNGTTCAAAIRQNSLNNCLKI